MRLVVSIILLFCTPLISRACMCGYISVCDAYGEADAIVAATIVDFRPAKLWSDIVYLDSKPGELIEGQKVRLDVSQWYKGRGGRLTLTQPVGGCDWEFKEKDRGEQFLFYLRRNRRHGTYSIMSCSRSDRLGRASEDLLWLNQLPNSLHRTYLSGTVLESDKAGTFPLLSGVPVIVRRKGRAKETATDESGVFSFWDLSPGKYTISARTPKGFGLDWTNSAQGSPLGGNDLTPRVITIAAGRCGGIQFALERNDETVN